MVDSGQKRIEKPQICFLKNRRAVSGGPGVFLFKSMRALTGFFHEGLFSEETARRKGFFQSLDPRFRVFGVLVFLLLVLFANKIHYIGLLYGLCVFLAAVSSLGVARFIAKTWIFIPLFSAMIAVPALFSVFTPGEPVWSGRCFGLSATITRQGLAGAALFVMRVATSVSFVFLLSATTRRETLLKVLRVFGVPKLFVMTASMTYRYLFILVEVLFHFFLAVRSRVGTLLSPGRRRLVAGFGLASLWRKSVSMQEEVYGAMRSRGYDGEPMMGQGFKAGRIDGIWLVSVIVFAGVSLWKGPFLR